jgi:FkbM family methyltransferase
MISQKKHSLLTHVVGLYRDLSPIRFGKAKLSKFALRNLGSDVVEAVTRDGCVFELHMPEDDTWFSIYFDGTFETGTLDVMKKIIRKDDVVLDIGANLGWYSVNIAKLLPVSKIHAFEPVPNIFSKLRRHCALNGVDAKVVLNQVALGDADGTIELHTFPDLPHGHSSISTLGKTDYVTSIAKMVTLDSFLHEHSVDTVDFIKMDVEGAEMLVLKGAESLLKRENAPIWVIELNTETAKSFGHTPTDVLQTLVASQSYELFKVTAGWGAFSRMQSIDDYANGDNAVCIPKCKADRLKGLID